MITSTETQEYVLNMVSVVDEEWISHAEENTATSYLAFQMWGDLIRAELIGDSRPQALRNWKKSISRHQLETCIEEALIQIDGFRLFTNPNDEQYEWVFGARDLLESFRCGLLDVTLASQYWGTILPKLKELNKKIAEVDFLLKPLPRPNLGVREGLKYIG